MSDDREPRIRERAAALWFAAGSPADRDLDFWLLAEEEIEANDGTALGATNGAESPAATPVSEAGAALI